MKARDPLKELQLAAARAAEHIFPGDAAGRVIIRGRTGSKLLDAAVPACIPGPAPAAESAPQPGWVVTERSAAFDGQAVPVSPSRLKLLRVLVEAEGPLTAKDLTSMAFDRATDVANTRYHIRELKKELKAAFAFDGDVIVGDDEGYRLVPR